MPCCNPISYEVPVSRKIRRFLFDESMPNGNPRKLLDNSYLKSIGWESKTSLDEGLKITTDWFKNNPDLVRT